MMKLSILSKTLLVLLFIPLMSSAWTRGIYLTEYTLQNTRTAHHLIEEAKANGVNTFVVDYTHMTKRYRQNIGLLKVNNIRYVARIVMFPDGATSAQLNSQAYLQKRFQQIMEAVSLGADVIQLDYVRFKPTQRQSSENAKQIYGVIKQVKELLRGKNVELQVDIFGVAAEREALAIGQNAELFAPLLDALCPMVYPSHYEPFRYHAVRPYETVYRSLVSLRQLLKNNPDVKVIAYIELSNYRYFLSHNAKVNYIQAQLRAVRDSQADGWYAWSPHNQYGLLFAILRSYH